MLTMRMVAGAALGGILFLPDALCGQETSRSVLDSLRTRIEAVSQRQMEEVRRIQEASREEMESLRRALEVERARIVEAERALVEAERALESERIRALTAGGGTPESANRQERATQIFERAVEEQARTQRTLQSADSVRAEMFRQLEVSHASQANQDRLDSEAVSESLAGLVQGVAARVDRPVLTNVAFATRFGYENFVGARMTALNPALAAYFRVEAGSLILEVMDETPAARAGVRAGDVIVEVAGSPVATVEEVHQAILENQARAADAIRLDAPAGSAAPSDPSSLLLRIATRNPVSVAGRITHPLPLVIVREGQEMAITLEP